ncbi:MAG: phosphate transport system protein [Phenylobacterium sp.]|jgi:phosphate transport system protein
MENDLHLNQHISRRFNQELEAARNLVLKMGGLVENQVEQGLKSLLDLDVELAEQVIKNDHLVNEMESEIDATCTDILARRQPAASDLRLMISIIKTITDLERIGDESIKLGKNAIKLTQSNAVPRQYVELRNLGELVKTLLKEALDAYARMDVEDAVRIIKADQRVDEEFDNISRLLITRMMEDPREIKNALAISYCARALERIGDHSKNICEFVVYLVQGKDVRHKDIELL